MEKEIKKLKRLIEIQQDNLDRERGNSTNWSKIANKQKKEIKSLKEDIARLDKRDCNASVQLCYDDGFNPFAREDLKIVDVGVSDNIYVVESEKFNKLISLLNKLKNQSGLSEWLYHHNEELQDELQEFKV
jgi:hypothetical protein